MIDAPLVGIVCKCTNGQINITYILAGIGSSHETRARATQNLQFKMCHIKSVQNAKFAFEQYLHGWLICRATALADHMAYV